MHVLLVALLQLVRLAQASIGDRDYTFRQCTDGCEQTGCIGVVSAQLAASQMPCDVACPSLNGQKVPLSLQLFGWTCQDDCRYANPMHCKSHALQVHTLCYDM